MTLLLPFAICWDFGCQNNETTVTLGLSLPFCSLLPVMFLNLFSQDGWILESSTKRHLEPCAVYPEQLYFCQVPLQAWVV